MIPVRGVRFRSFYHQSKLYDLSGTTVLMVWSCWAIGISIFSMWMGTWSGWSIQGTGFPLAGSSQSRNTVYSCYHSITCFPIHRLLSYRVTWQNCFSSISFSVPAVLNKLIDCAVKVRKYIFLVGRVVPTFFVSSVFFRAVDHQLSLARLLWGIFHKTAEEYISRGHCQFSFFLCSAHHGWKEIIQRVQPVPKTLTTTQQWPNSIAKPTFTRQEYFIMGSHHCQAHQKGFSILLWRTMEVEYKRAHVVSYWSAHNQVCHPYSASKYKFRFWWDMFRHFKERELVASMEPWTSCGCYFDVVRPTRARLTVEHRCSKLV